MQSSDSVGDRFKDDAKTTVGARRDISHLLENNLAWIKSKRAKDPKFFEKLGSKHTPYIFWIGDADARMAANEIIGAEPGEVFVHRNIGNQVNDIDVSLMACLHYAVDVLKVEHIVVCGMYQSNAIDKIFSTTDLSAPLENWISHIRTVYRLNMEELDSIKDDKKSLRRLVELNVMEQCIKIFQLAVVQRRRVQTLAEAAEKGVASQGAPQIHALVYDVETGKLKKLDWVPKDLEEQYGLFEPAALGPVAGRGRSLWQRLFGRQ